MTRSPGKRNNKLIGAVYLGQGRAAIRGYWGCEGAARRARNSGVSRSLAKADSSLSQAAKAERSLLFSLVRRRVSKAPLQSPSKARTTAIWLSAQTESGSALAASSK